MDNIEYALETMDAGVLVLSRNGMVNYSNPRANAIFEIQDSHCTRLFRDMIADTDGKNNEMIDLVIDIIYSGNQQKSQTIRYTNHSGCSFYLLMSCSKMSNNEFVFTFSDQTELVSVEQEKKDATVILTSFFLISCLWTVGVSIWMQTGKVFNVGYLTVIVEAIATINMLILLHKTSIRLKDLGLSTEALIPTLKRTAVRVIILFSLFCGIKMAVLHFQYGLSMMLGAGVLSVLLGYIYKKDQNIYGVTIIHYCFGKFADFLHFL